MNIQISSAMARGMSKKSAFDSALAEMNLNHYNLVQYSSVIPEDASIERVEDVRINSNYGSPVSCVIARGFGELGSNNNASGRVVAHLVWNRSDSGCGWFLEGNNRVIDEEERAEMNDNRPSYSFDADDYSDVIEYYYYDDESRQFNREKWLCCTCVAVYGPIRTEY